MNPSESLCFSKSFEKKMVKGSERTEVQTCASHAAMRTQSCARSPAHARLMIITTATTWQGIAILLPSYSLYYFLHPHLPLMCVRIKQRLCIIIGKDGSTCASWVPWGCPMWVRLQILAYLNISVRVKRGREGSRRELVRGREESWMGGIRKEGRKEEGYLG